LHTLRGDLHDRTVLHLDWLGSISPGELRAGPPRIDTHFTVAQSGHWYTEQDYNGRALHGSSALSQLFRLRPGTFYIYRPDLDGYLLPRVNVQNTSLGRFSFIASIGDATTTVRRLRDLTDDGSLPNTIYSRLRPNAVRCCEISDPYQRIRLLIPCSEVVRTFYAPTMPFLVRTYQGLFIDRTSIHEPGIVFNGTKFYRLSEPLVSRRTPPEAELHFAEGQLRALIYRAIMTNQRERIFPIAAMPPFRGQALLSGLGVRYTSRDWTSYLLTADIYCCRDPEDLAAFAFARSTDIIPLHGLTAPKRGDFIQWLPSLAKRAHYRM
jgi:hypothetical protein